MKIVYTFLMEKKILYIIYNWKIKQAYVNKAILLLCIEKAFFGIFTWDERHGYIYYDGY